MLQTNCLTLSTEANAKAKATCANIEGTGRMGFRFESQGPGKHTFAPVEELRVKDYVVQPVLGGVVVFIDPESLEKGYGTDIHVQGKDFVFVQSDRTMPKVAEKSEEQKSEEKARRASARAAKGMKPGAEKERVARAAKDASLAADEAKAVKKKAKEQDAQKREQDRVLDQMAEDGAHARAIELQESVNKNRQGTKIAAKSAPAKAPVKKAPAKKTK